MNRQIPNDLPKDEVEACIREIERLLSVKWLEKKSNYNNKLKSIWGRRDFLSTIELYTLGNAVKLIREKGNGEWLEDFCKQVKSPKESNQVGAIFEAIAFSMFASEQQISLPPPGQAGYDLVVSLGERKLNISCKSLQNSDEYKKLKTEFEFVSSFFKDSLKRLSITGRQLFIYSDEAVHVPSRTKLKKHIKKILKSNISQSKLDGLDFYMKTIKSDVDGFSLSSFDVSYLSNLVTKYKPSEQKRYEQLFKNASKNIAKHSPVKSGVIANAIIIKLPESISIESAKKWTENKFNSDGSKVALVILIRLLPAISREKNTTQTTIEAAFIINDNSDSKLLDLIDYKSGEMFKLTLPVGSLVMDGLNNIVESDLGALNINESYIFQKGNISYQAVNEGSFEFNLSQLPNVSYDIIAKPNTNGEYIKIGVIRPPENEFTAI